MNTNSPDRWFRLARAAAFSINLGAVLQWARKLFPWFGALLLLAGGLLRYSGRGWSWESALVSWLSILLLAAGGAALFLFRTSRSRVLESRGLERLDTVLGTNNALSAAAAGCGRWPEVPDHADHRLRIAWPRVLPAFLFSLVLALSGALLPLPASGQPGVETPPPRSHGEIASTIAQLEQAGTFDQKQIEELKKQLDALRDKPAADWYSHANIEAADHLQAGMLEQLRSLESSLNKAAGGLEALQSPDSAANSSEQQQAAANFKSAMEKIKASNPGLNEKLMQSLSKIDPSALKSLSGKELQDALSQMKQAAGACKNCQGGQGQCDAQSELDDLLAGGNGRGRGKGKEGRGEGEEGEDGPGKGGVGRGPGVAPLPLSDSPSDLGTSNPEALQNPDLRRTGLGDAIGASDTEHKLDKTSTVPVEAGAAAAGVGGDSVTHESLLPSEKALLKGVFK